MRLLAGIFSLILLLAPGFTPGQGASDPIRIMTFNIRYDNPSDGIYSWSQRKALVAEVLRTDQPDIIGLQEVLSNQLEDLLAAFPWYRTEGVGRDDGKTRGEYAPILYHADRFNLISSSVFWLSETPAIPGSISWGAACTRIVTWVQLQGHRNRDTLFVFNTHWDHVSSKARLRSASLLLDSIRSIAGNHPVVVTGDFNCTLQDKACRRLTKWLKDAGTIARQRDACPTTFIGFPAEMNKAEVIDHVFVRPAPPVQVQKYVVNTHQQNGQYPSDHLPVWVEIVGY